VRESSWYASAAERVQGYVRRYAAQSREVERIGPFLATFGRHSNGPYLNYAVPDEGAEPTGAEVDAVVSAYGRRGLVPRVELITSLAPLAAQELEAAGFRADGAYSVMGCEKSSFRDVGRAGAEVVFAEDRAEDDDLYTVALEIRREAFGEPDHATAADVARLRANGGSGGISALALDRQSKEPVGSATCLVPYKGVTELASLGVLPGWRRRGFGTILSAALTKAALDGGADIVFLTAAHEEGERLYERVGYSTIGQSLHMSFHGEVLRD
jgi:GNAT superfamily N-acetyltransferase